jgi:AraC family transcriptional regulator
LAKIAVELERALVNRELSGAPGGLTERVLAQGDGWTVRDVICTAGPRDRAFEEQHHSFSIAVVAVGSFQYRSHSGEELMTPGSLLLGNAGQFFQCAHEHGSGDRCLAFGYSAEFFEKLAAEEGLRSRETGFRILRVPPVRELAPLVTQAITQASAVVARRDDAQWEELALRLAARALCLSAGLSHDATVMPPAAVARVTRVVRRIEQQPQAPLTLAALAGEAGLSSYHFLRLFERLTGLTPHQYILRTRLREAAVRLASPRTKVLDAAFDCGFGDVSNFNRAFRSEFGVSPRAFLRQSA